MSKIKFSELGSLWDSESRNIKSIEGIGSICKNGKIQMGRRRVLPFSDRFGMKIFTSQSRQLRRNLNYDLLTTNNFRELSNTHYCFYDNLHTYIGKFRSKRVYMNIENRRD